MGVPGRIKNDHSSERSFFVSGQTLGEFDHATGVFEFFLGILGP